MNKLFEQINIEKTEHQISDLMEIKYGFGLPERDRVKGIIPVYASSGLVGFHNESKVKKPSIIIGRKGNVGSISYSESESYPIDTVFYVDETAKDFDLKYIYYLLQRINLPSYGGDSAVPGLSRDTVYSITVETPKEETQKKIASILGAYDEKIENNNNIIKNLEETAQTIFNEWFVNFKFPGYEKVKMVDSEVGEIPEGWRVGKLSELLKVKHGFAFPGNKFKTKGIYPVIKIKNILEDNTVSLDKAGFIDINDFGGILENFEIFNWDILIAMTGATSGKIAVLMDNYDRYFLNQRVGKFEFLKEENRWFSYIYLTQEQNRNLLLTMSDGSAQGNLSPKQVENLETIIPNEMILKSFHKIVQSMFENKFFLQLENNKLKESRNQLLTRLI